MVYRIKFFSSFCDSKNCKSVYERLCETHLMSNYGIDKEIYITDGDDYTHVVIMNTAMPVLPTGFPKENVIGLAFEPPVYLGINYKFIEYAQQYISKYFIGTKSNLPSPFIEYYSYMWHITPLTYVPQKRNVMSIMISNKTQQKGHKYRHQLAEAILKTNIPVDIYGKGCEFSNYNKSDPRIKGKFTSLEPYESYEFHIAIENIQTNDYFSEKLTNTLLCGTTPVYLGARNVREYFPDKLICLSGDLNLDMKMIANIIQDPSKYRRVVDPNEIKKKISLMHNLDTVFTTTV